MDGKNPSEMRIWSLGMPATSPREGSPPSHPKSPSSANSDLPVESVAFPAFSKGPREKRTASSRDDTAGRGRLSAGNFGMRAGSTSSEWFRSKVASFGADWITDEPVSGRPTRSTGHRSFQQRVFPTPNSAIQRQVPLGGWWHASVLCISWARRSFMDGGVAGQRAVLWILAVGFLDLDTRE